MEEAQRTKYDELMGDPEFRDLFIKEMDADHAAEVARLEALVSTLRQEVQIHAQEARSQKATVHEIYQIVTGGTGEPGDWHGAEPVREYVKRLRDALESARMYAVYLEDALYRRRRTVISLERL